MLLEVQDGPVETVVTAGGRLTVASAGRLRDALLQAFASGRAVRLVLRRVEEADLTLLQVVCSAERTAAARGVAFRLEGADREAAVASLIAAAGFGGRGSLGAAPGAAGAASGAGR